MARLSAATLPAAAADVCTPAYDRTGPASVAHLGVGAFARAHLAVYADELLAAGWPARIRGVSLRSPRAEAQLGPQDGLFTVAVREPGPEVPLRVIGSVTSLGTGPDAAVAAIAAPDIRLVTLTITEKGYDADPADAGTAAAVLAAGLAERRRAGVPPPVVAPLDNVLDNGVVLADRVHEAAVSLDRDLAEWISGEVRFASSVVDRMVPAAADADLADVGRRLGLDDHAAVVAEDHRSWVLEAVDGLPPLGDVGVEVVADVDLFQRRKLWLLNGPHSALAYAGLLTGHRTISEAAADPTVAGFVRALVDDVLAVAEDLGPGTGPASYAAEALRRFANPALGHTCAQVGADGSRKLSQRLLPVVARRRARGLGTERAAIVVATWIAAVTGARVAGRTLTPVDDPATEPLVRAMRSFDLRRTARLAVGDDAAFAAEVAAAIDELLRVGPAVLDGAPILAEER